MALPPPISVASNLSLSSSSFLNYLSIINKNHFIKFKHHPLSSSSFSSYSAINSKQLKSSMSNSLLTTSNNDKITLTTATNDSHQQQDKKILLFDIMDTIVRDPFYQDIPAFFQMSFKELIDSKHPTAWVDFELGSIDEAELARKFFKDGRDFDLEGLKNCMRRGYSFLEGVEELLIALKRNDYEMHASTNYPSWYQMIEDKLKLSTYLSWSFCSCAIGKRKPDLEFYAEIVRRLDVDPGNCIFIDDRLKNVEAAVEAGMIGLQFKDATTLSHNLSLLGILTGTWECCNKS